MNFGQAKAQAGIERATRRGGCVANAFTGESFRRFAPMRAGQFTSLRVFERFASDAQRRFVAEKVSGPAVEAGANIRQIACDRAPAGQFGVVAGEGFDASPARINRMKEAEDRLAADEVRALARCAAQAARETAEKIADSVQNRDRGVKISGCVAGHFAEILEKARHVDALVAAIARASNEQTQGIGQVNLAGAQLDTAAQSEELKAHATGRPAAIGQCLAMIGRARTNDPHGRPGVPRAGGNVPSTGPARVGPRPKSAGR